MIVTRQNLLQKYIARPMLAGLILLCCACSKELTPVEQGIRDGVLLYSNGEAPYTLDPHRVAGFPAYRLVTTLFEGLVSINPYTLKAEPGVAQRWDVSNDATTYRFHLRKNARWSNGGPITARDFAWSWQYKLSTKGHTSYDSNLFAIKNARAFAQGDVENFSDVGVNIIDDYQLEVTLAHPTPYFLQLLASPGTFALHRPSVEKYGPASKLFEGWTQLDHIVTNGPFRVDRVDEVGNYFLSKSTSYWGKDKVKLNGMVFYHNQDRDVEYQMFLDGQLHYTLRIPGDRIKHYQTANDKAYRQTLFLSTFYYMFNTRRFPFDDIKVRQALSLAIDRTEVNERVFSSSMHVASSFTPPGIKGYYPREQAVYDPDKARQLLAEAGYPNGKNWPMVKLSSNVSTEQEALTLVVLEMWRKELNIDIVTDNMTWSQYTDALRNSDFQLARMMWVGDYVEPSTFLNLHVSSESNNWSGFASKRYDDIILNDVLVAPTQEARNALYAEAETILMDQVPVVPVYNPTSKHLIHTAVRGMPPNVIDLINFRYVSLTDKQ